MGPRKPKETIPQNFSDAKESLEKEFRKKSFSEKHISEFQTREAPIRGAENPETTRGEVFRFERGQILKGYNILRKQIRDAEEKGEDATEKKRLLKEIRGRAKVLEKDLDELNRQYYENVKNVEIETEYGKFSVPVAELDLKRKEDEESEKDERIPYFLLGGVATNYHQTAALSMGLALDGRRVLVPAWPEQAMVGRPDNFSELLKQQKGLELHKEYAKQTIRSIGLDKVNIMGYSMGGAVALELAQDQDFKEMQDLVVVEPLGLEKKGTAGLGKDFMIKEGLLKTFPYSEARIKTYLQGNRESVGSWDFLLENNRILSKKHFDAEKLGKIMPKGRYQLWFGAKSSITDRKTAEKVFSEAEDLRKQQDPDASPIEIHIVKGGTHGWPCMNSLGFSRLLKEEKPKEQVTTVKLSELENSGMARIIKNIKE
ncbi:MAG TPA: alpha/beta hydrolase [Candidatus Paceibacterota bacterium]|nr:alpha/beta hydrolase [Candidatus Paceibacterota bacterium]